MAVPAPGGKIRVLDGETVSRIAAGEVVERPASVIKELVENAIDAGARTIEVEVSSRGGQIAGIRVTDDGCGMTPKDAALACTRHATSKIAKIEDLSVIRSLGFRGEALASIAAVSRLTITTRAVGGDLAGTRVEYEGGRLVRQEECGCPPGTTVEVRDLFFNTPARRKFMRSLGAEMAYITGTLERTILSHPGISFHVVHNGRTLISAPAGTLRDAALHLFGVEWERSLVPVDYAGHRARIEGLISRPSFSRQNPYQIFISVNRRPVASRSLALAVREGYGTLLPANRFPVAILDISVDPSTVDPNVHPTKREIRIAREEEVRDEVARAVGSALESMAVIAGAGNAARVAQQRSLPLGQPGTVYEVRPLSPGLVSEPGVHATSGKGSGKQEALGIHEDPPEGTGTPFLPEMDVIGQLDNTYILAAFRGGEDLILIDQHASHERILYDRLAGRSESPPQSQELLVPVVLDLSPRESSIVSDLFPVLSDAGFCLEEFGKGSYAVRAVPVVLGRQIDAAGAREIVSAILAGSPRKGPAAADEIRKIVACRGAVKAGTPLSIEECRALLDDLRRTSHPYSCPHGRPTMVVLKRKEIDGLFLRA